MGISYLSCANAPYWGFLPMGMTNFGGDTQIFTIPEYANSNIGLLLNPMGQAAIRGTSSLPWGIQTPSVTPDSIRNYAQNLLTPVLNNMTSSSINTSLQNVSMTKTRLNAMLQQEGITEEQKQKINELLERLDEQEKKLKELTTSTDLDPQTAYNKAFEIEKEVRKIVNDVVTLSNEIAGVSTSTTSTTSTDTTGTTSTTSTSSTSTTSTTSTDTTGTTQGTDAFGDDIIAAVDAFYDATYQVGTDNETFNAVCEYIDKDNVMDIMLAWDQLHSTEEAESFMTAFMWDADSDQKEKYGKHIARALRAKALELGIYNECKDDFAAIDKEMGSWIYISNDIAKNYDNIIKKIAEKEGKTYDTSKFKYD